MFIIIVKTRSLNGKIISDINNVIVDSRRYNSNSGGNNKNKKFQKHLIKSKSRN